ncbi:MAG TPA: class I SAM-dependent methyltransferase [Candidatus Paceibacterota bacterium]|nr:class I SAM-dependent methyltransferase [Candidatus Paceibacterota bacterium]
MKKDLKSYERHNAHFNTSENNDENTLAIIRRYDGMKQFERMGFALALSLSSRAPKTHIDIGSGNGWLLRKMSPYFETTIGVEPSSTAIALCKRVHAQLQNMRLVNADMCDGIDQLQISEPVFLTTSVVLTHIEDYYIAAFLEKVNDLPVGSILCFAEPYDTNHQWGYWHVRSKDWWIKNLPNWQLQFLNLEIDGYAHTIYGVCVGKDEVRTQKLMSLPQKAIWNLSVVYHQAARVFRKLKTLVK